MSTDSVVCEGWLKWNHLSCTFLKKLPKADIAKLILKIGIGNRSKWSIESITWQQDALTISCFDLPLISDMNPLNIDWMEEEEEKKESEKKQMLRSWTNKRV